MGLYYNPNPPHIGARQPLEARKLTPPQSGPAPQNPPFMGGARVSQAVLSCWAAAAAVAAIMPIVAVNLDPPQDGAVRFVVTGSRVPQAVLNAWIPPPPAPIVAINMDPPQSGPTPDRPPLVGMRIPAAVQVAWIPPPPAPIVARNLNPPIGIAAPQNPPLIGMRIPVAVQVAWIPPPPAPIVAINLDPPQSGPSPDNPPILGMRIPGAVHVAWIPPPPAPIRGAILTPPSAPARPPLTGTRVPIEVLRAWIPPPPAPILARNLNPPISAPVIRQPRLVREPIYLLEISVYNPDTLAVETRYFSTRTKSTRNDDTPAATVYSGRMVNAGEINRKMFDNGGTIGAPSINSGYFELNNADGVLNYLLDYGIGGRSFTLKRLEDYDDYVTSATTVFQGVLRGIASVDRRKSLQLRIRDKMELLKKQLLTTLYGGSTTSSGATADGDATLLNVAKPKAFGNVLRFTPVCANTFDLIYQVSDSAVSVIVVYDGGVQLTSDGNYASLALLQAAVITAGRFATCLSAGYFRLASAAIFKITADVEAESLGWGAGFDLYEPGPVAKRIMTSAGISSGDIDASFDNMMTVSGAGSYRCGILVKDTSTTIMDAVTEILASVGAALISTADDKFACAVLCSLPLPVSRAVAAGLTLPPGSPVDTFTTDNVGKDASLQLFATRSEEGDGTPVWWINQNYSPYDTTQSRGDLAGSVNDAKVLDLAKAYRTTVEFDASVKTVHPLAQTLAFNSRLTRLPGVNAQALRMLMLYKERRDYVMLTLSMERVDDVQVLNIGNEIALDIAAFGYSDKSFYIVGRRDDFATRKTTLLLFG